MKTETVARFDCVDGESGAILLRAPASILSECAQSGDVTDNVASCARSDSVEWCAPLDTLRRYLQSTGGWSREECEEASETETRERALWCAAGDYKESLRERAREWKRERKLGGPGLDSYVFDADVLCEDCAHDAIDAIAQEAIEECNEAKLESEDTDDCPAPSFCSESDSVQHCGECGERLDIALTSDGIESTRESLAEAIAHGRTDSVESLGSAIDLASDVIERAQERASWNARRRAALLARAPLLPFDGAPRTSEERAP